MARCPPPSWGRLNSNQPPPPPNTLRWTFLDDNSNSSLPGCMGVYRRILYPLRRVVWLEPPAFQEESPTFHNFGDPILHNIVIKDIFALVYLVSTEQITGRVWKLLELATTVRKWIEIDIPAIVCSKLRQTMGRRKRNRKIFCVEGAPHRASSMRYSERRWTSRFALIGIYVRRSIKNEWKRKLWLKKLRLVTSEFLIPIWKRGHKCMAP